MFSLIDPTDHSGELVPDLSKIIELLYKHKALLSTIFVCNNEKSHYRETFSELLADIQVKEEYYGYDFRGYKITTTKEGRKKRLTGDFLLGFPISPIMYPTFASDRLNISPRKIIYPEGFYLYREFSVPETITELSKKRNIRYGYLGEKKEKSNLLALEYLTRDTDCIGYLNRDGENTMLYTGLSYTHIETPDESRRSGYLNVWDVYPGLEALDIKAREENIR